MPGLYTEGDHIVDSKKRYNCFWQTDLDLTLKALGVETLLITGVNTNSCVLSTASDGCNRDYRVVVVEDCVDTMDGAELHEAAVKVIRAAYGWVLPGDEALAHLHTLNGAAVRP